MHRYLILALIFLTAAWMSAGPAASVAPHIPEQGALSQTGYPDTIQLVYEPYAATALAHLTSGELDLYIGPVTSPQIAAQVQASPGLDAYPSFSSFHDLTFNPAGPVFSLSGELNPFAVRRVRQAVNFLVDRDYIAQEIFGGLAVPGWTPLYTASADYARLSAVTRRLELDYRYNPQLARQVISAEMLTLGASLVDGKWHYKGSPVVIKFLIRSEDERRLIGDYVADQLESIGFITQRAYKNHDEAMPIWLTGNPEEGLFHIYTGSWAATQIPRDSASSFAFFYTHRGMDDALWQAYTPTDEFLDLAFRLADHDFASQAERQALMSQALEWALEDSVHLWLVQRVSLNPRRAEVSTAADLYGGVWNSTLWPYTLQRADAQGGTVTVGVPWFYDLPWNPLGGGATNYDLMAARLTGDQGMLADPYTGVGLPQRIERAELTVVEGLPVTNTSSWLTLAFTPTIPVPPDAWVNWNAVQQRFLTASQVYSVTQYAQVKSVVYYPPDLFATAAWHDGSPLSAADFVLNMILTFDRAKPASAVYDPSRVEHYRSFMTGFKGMRILSTDPLVIEHYSAVYQADAENNLTTWWPFYTHGPGPWHNLALGLKAEAEGLAAFSQTKSADLDVPWLDFLTQPSLGILNDQLLAVQGTGWIPYAPTLSAYIPPAEAAARWDNLSGWYAQRAHFWVGDGPYLLSGYTAQPRTFTMQRNPAFIDPFEKWAAYAATPAPEITITGPEQVRRGASACFSLQISLHGAPYPTADLEQVHYLAVDLLGRVVHTGKAAPVADGLWQIVLSEAETALLPAGLTRLEVVAASRRVVLPEFRAHPFTFTLEAPLTASAGGLLVYTDPLGAALTLSVPPGAVTGSLTLQYIPLASVTAQGLSGFTGFAFDLNLLLDGAPQPALTFSTPAVFTLEYPSSLVEGFNENHLTLLVYDPTWNVWHDAAHTCSPQSSYVRQPVQNRISLPICRAGRYALFDPTYSLFLPVLRR